MLNSQCVCRGHAYLQPDSVNMKQFYYSLSFEKRSQGILNVTLLFYSPHSSFYQILPTYWLIELCIVFTVRSPCFLLVPFAFLSSSVQQWTRPSFYFVKRVTATATWKLGQKWREEMLVPSSNVCFTREVMLAV